MADNPLYEKLLEQLVLTSYDPFIFGPIAMKYGEALEVEIKIRKAKMRQLLNAIWPEIEASFSEDATMRAVFENILGVIAATRDADGYTPEKALEIIENFAHLGVADGLAGDQRG